MNDSRLSARPDRNLALELVRATEAAAILASPWVGRGRKNAADGAAVDAMRSFLNTVDFDGRVVIGEGEKDDAPMLHNGESVGTGRGPACDVAVDPIDGTSLTAAGRPNALSVIAVAERGTMLDVSSVFYMDKLVAAGDAGGVIDLDQSIGDNIRELARARRKPVSEIRVAILDRPRHAEAIEDVRAAGAATELLLDGDVAGGITAALGGRRVDMCYGVGGSPEAIVTAAAITALGGFMQARVAPRDAAEAGAAASSGLVLGRAYTRGELVRSENTFFVATGVTDGALAAGVRRQGGLVTTESIVLRSASGTVRRIRAEHATARWFRE